MRYETGISIPVGLAVKRVRPDRTIAFFEEPGDRIPVPPLAESFNLTVGQLFGWLTE